MQFGTPKRPLAVVLLVSSLMAGSAWPGPAALSEQPRRAPFARADRPNIVLILTDDQRFDEIDHMPVLQSELQAKGVTFANGFVVDPLCCPSRATILTGRYAHSTDVYRNKPPHGGFITFTKAGEDQSTIATWLHDAGYRTALIGKYLNGYSPKKAAYVPPGWDVWDALALNNTPNGEGKGGYYNYTLSENGTTVTFGKTEADYSTTVLDGLSVDFIENTPHDQPLFLYLAPRAPHDPATPPQKYKSTFSNLPPLRLPSYDEEDVSDKPAWLQTIPPWDDKKIQQEDEYRRKQYGTLLAVDDAIGDIIGALDRSHRLANTLILFASDNGVAIGEHRWAGKKVAYEESIRVPIIARFDPLTQAVAGTVRDELALNLDFAQTFADAAGVSAPGAEGMSLVPLLSGQTPAWRSDFGVEFLRTSSNNLVPTYCAVRTDSEMYVEYDTGEEELYDLATDPYELQNMAGDPDHAAMKAALHVRMLELCNPPPPGFTP